MAALLVGVWAGQDNYRHLIYLLPTSPLVSIRRLSIAITLTSASFERAIYGKAVAL